MYAQLLRTEDVLHQCCASAVRHARRLAARDSGFTMIELLMAMTVILIVSTPLVTVMTTSVVTNKYNRQRTLGQQAVMQKVESIRALAYGSIGTAAGNPAGTVSTSDPLTLAGMPATLSTQITYVDDAVPSGYVSKADYKKVVLTVKRNSDQKSLAQEVTYISPPGDGTYGPTGKAIVNAKVMDAYLVSGLQGATVTLGTGPSATRADATDVSGTATFPDLTPNPTTGGQAYYDLTPALSGYTTLSDDVPPSGVSHVQLVAGQNFTTVIRVYKGSSFTVNVNAAAGTPLAAPCTITLLSTRGAAQTYAPASGLCTTGAITTFGGEPVVPGSSFTVSAKSSANLFSPVTTTIVAPPGYPATVTLSATSTLSATVNTMRTMNVTVKNTGGSLVSGARVDVTKGPVGGGATPAGLLLTGVTNASGVATFSVPGSATNSYTVKAFNTVGAGTGTWTGIVNAATVAVPVTVS